jgi:hypothetical protein
MLMVTAATIPVIMPALQNRKMRESSRLVSGFFSGARARAIEAGRPVGVMLERSNGLPFAMTLSYVEVPPPYSGDTVASMCNITNAGGPQFLESDLNAPASLFRIWFRVVMTTAQFNAALVRVGDQIQFDYHGPLFTVLGPDVGPKLTNPMAMPVSDGVIDIATPAQPQITLDVAYLSTAAIAPGRFPWTAAANLPFQIIRQPLRSSAAPLQLPEGAVVDLVNSGMTTSGTFGAALAFNPIITFAPNGGVDQVTDGPAGQFRRPTGPMFLLVGRRELMPDIKSTDQNLFDPTPASQHLSNFWVMIAPQSGQVTVAENAQNQGPIVDPMNHLQNARSFAAGGQGTGGR